MTINNPTSSSWSFEQDPVKKTVSKSLVFTGKIYDLTTAGLGKNLKVSICDVTEVDGTITETKILKTVLSDSDGSYYIALDDSDLANYNTDAPFTLEMFVFQGRTQLNLDKRAQLVVGEFNKSKLEHINVYTLPSFKGLLKRKNDVEAIGCRVELYKVGELEPMGFDVTDINGQYEIPYSVGPTNAALNAKPKLFLKYYNSEDIVVNNPEENPILESISGSKVVYSNTNYPLNKAATTTHDINELIIDVDPDTGDKYYYVVTNVNDDLIPKLIYIKTFVSEVQDEVPVYKYDYWRIVGTDKILDKRVIYDNSGKQRVVYFKGENVGTTEVPIIRKSQNAGKILLRQNTSSNLSNGSEQIFTSEITEYIKEIEEYRPSNSPKIIPSKYIEEINFKFTKESIDLYTKLMTRKNELAVQTTQEAQSQFSE